MYHVTYCSLETFISNVNLAAKLAVQKGLIQVEDNNPSFPSLSDLVTVMEGGTATNGWDIVCSYSLDALNQILATSHQNGKLVQAIQLTAQGTDVSGHPYTIEFDITLGAPTMQFFSDLSGECQLTMSIAGTYAVNGGEVQSISGGYNLVANVPLGAIYGDGQVATTGNVVTFEDGQQTQAHIVLHFKGTTSNDGSPTGTFFTIQPQPSNSSEVLNILLTKLQTYFLNEVNEIDYSLTALTASPANTSISSASNEIAIIPKSFVFGCDTGVLSLYILTENSGNATGNPRPVFQPGGKEILPIPQGHTASIVFSKAFVEKVYLNAAYFQIDNTVEVGIGVKYTAAIPPLLYNPSHLGNPQLQSDSINIDYSKLPFSILFQTNQASISWMYQQTIHWTWSDIGTQEEGTTEIQVSLPGSLPGDKSPKITGQPNVQGNDVSVDLEIVSSDFTVSVNSPSKFWSAGPTVAETITSYLKENTPPSISIKFGGMNYFAVSNLLFPDSQAFHVDTGVGVYVPYDMLLVGNIQS